MKRFIRRQLKFEVEFIRKVLKRQPNFVSAWIALGDLYARLGELENSLAVDLKLSQMKPADPMVLYNLACSYSLLDDLDNAMKTIKKAIVCGYDDFDHLNKDDDLTNLRNSGEFQSYLHALSVIDKHTVI